VEDWTFVSSEHHVGGVHCWLAYWKLHGLKSKVVLCVYMSIVGYMAYKSHVNGNHLHLHIRTFYSYIVVVYIFYLHLHKANVNICQIHLHSSCKCFGMCKCIYYIPLVTIPSCKSILVSYGCMFWWVFFLVMGHLVGLSPKHYEFLPPPQVKIISFTFFYTTM